MPFSKIWINITFNSIEDGDMEVLNMQLKFNLKLHYCSNVIFIPVKYFSHVYNYCYYLCMDL